MPYTQMRVRCLTCSSTGAYSTEDRYDQAARRPAAPPATTASAAAAAAAASSVLPPASTAAAAAAGSGRDTSYSACVKDRQGGLCHSREYLPAQLRNYKGLVRVLIDQGTLNAPQAAALSPRRELKP